MLDLVVICVLFGIDNKNLSKGISQRQRKQFTNEKGKTALSSDGQQRLPDLVKVIIK